MIIVNFATKQYRNAQRRLMDSVNGKGLFISDYPPGWKTHQESPYQFKIYAIKQAFELDDIVLWMDASMYRVGDLSVIENIIKTDGYFMEESGHYCSQWTNDFTKNYFKLTDEESVKGPGGFTMFSAGLLGLNKNSEIAIDFLNQWEAAANAGCFKGDYSNHRHDMSSASIIACRMKLKYQSGGTHMAYIGPGYGKPKSSVVIHCQGML